MKIITYRKIRLLEKMINMGVALVIILGGGLIFNEGLSEEVSWIFFILGGVMVLLGIYGLILILKEKENKTVLRKVERYEVINDYKN